MRFIEALVDGLDLVAAGFARVQPKETGRPGYAPADLLKLYFYGYLNIPCSREDPKILGVDDAEVVSDVITVGKPVPGHVVAQEVQDGDAECSSVSRMPDMVTSAAG